MGFLDAGVKSGVARRNETTILHDSGWDCPLYGIAVHLAAGPKWRQGKHYPKSSRHGRSAGAGFQDRYGSAVARHGAAGGSATYVLTVTGLNGFNKTPAFTVTGLAHASFGITSISGATSTTTMTAGTTSSTVPGAYPFTVTATSGSLSHSASGTVTVNGPITVCASGCTYSTAQAALNASADGSTIVLKAGQNSGSLTIPGNRHNLTFKSSLIDNYPRNYRIDRSDPALARLTTVSIGESALWLAGVRGSTLTNQPGNVPQPHNLAVGDSVVLGGSRFSAYECAVVNQPPYTDGACDASRVGYFNIRTDTGLANGMAIDFLGRTLPPPLKTGTLYYIVGFVYGGSVANADKFKIALAPGGPPIAIPQFNPTGQDLVIEVPPLPQRIGDTMFVVATPTSATVQLSATKSGAPVTFTQTAKGYNGSGLAVGFGASKVAPVHDITFDGIEVSPTSDYGVYYPFYISSAIGNAASEHYNITIWRCWIHGADDQQDFPMATLNLAGHNLEVGWSVVENTYSTGNDTQGIGFVSTGTVSIHDNEIKGNSEGIMSGGNVPWFAYKSNTTGISVRRNYIWKPLKAYVGIVATYLGPTQFEFLSRYGGADCASVAADPISATIASPMKATSPIRPLPWLPAPSGPARRRPASSRRPDRRDRWIHLPSGRGVPHGLQLRRRRCLPGGGCFKYVAEPSFSPASTRIGIAVIGGGGTFDGSFDQQNRNMWSKNLLESKYGDGWLIEGNVFHRQDNCDNGPRARTPRSI